jgi:magnesium-transporting ATPase (P-type)
MVVAIFDQALERKTMEDNPEAYGVLRKGALFNTRIFSAWILRAMLTSLLVFFMVNSFMRS